MTPVIPEAEFIELVKKHGARKAGSILGLPERTIHARRRRIELNRNIVITTPNPMNKGGVMQIEADEHPARRHLKIQDGVMLVGSDAHYWPGITSTSHRAFVKFCEALKPAVVILNGDELDCASNSRHPPIGWEDVPPLHAELEWASERIDEIFKASPNAKHIWNLGNHDGRFETRLAMQAPEYAKVTGFHLKDHFPGWQPAWSTWINDDVVVKHRFKGGMYAPRNNTLYAGKTMVTGHLHSQKVMPFTDYYGTRWGVDAGCMADPDGPQFVDYTEDNPKDWREGFAVLTFHKGELMDPELVRVRDDSHVVYRATIIEV